MIKLVTIQKNGKVTIPKEVRKEIGFTGEEQYVLVTDEGNIILKRVSKSQSSERMLALLKGFRAAFKKAGITKKDVEKEIKAVRAKNTVKNGKTKSCS